MMGADKAKVRCSASSQTSIRSEQSVSMKKGDKT